MSFISSLLVDLKYDIGASCIIVSCPSAAGSAGVSPRGNVIRTSNPVAEQQATRAKRRREQRLRAAAWRADTVGRLPVRVHRSLPLTFRVEGDFVVIDLAKSAELDSPPGSINAIPAGMEPDDSEERFRQMERQWHRQMVLRYPVTGDRLPDLQNPW